MLTERYVWESRQRIYYQMRHFGLPRLNKPFPTAADGHYPEVDMAIRRLKPFWIGQVTAGDRLCSFTSMKQQLDAMNDCAADFFNFELIQRSNFMRQLRVAIDFMLLRGRGVIKATVDPMDKYRLVHEAVDPYFIIMRHSAKGFEDADEFIHARNMTIPAYMRLPSSQYNLEGDVIRKIRGGQDFQSLGLENLEVRLREGIAFTNLPNRTVIFEHYEKTGGGWNVHTYCPQAPDVPLRNPYQVFVKVDNKPSQPFFSFQMEVKDEGWYSPRGLGELLGPIEQYMTKLWNFKADTISFSNTPMFTGEKELVNGNNIRFQPGEYIPGNIASIQQGPPPIDFDREIMFAKSIGEEQSQSPDFGITEEGPQGGKARTATENNRIGALASAGASDNANMFREDLVKLYRHCWALICTYKDRDFKYYASQEIKILSDEVLHDQYLITPDGSPENWNRLQRFQKAVGLLQVTAGNPNVDQEPITKELLTAYDGQMALKAFVPTNMKGATEFKDEFESINGLVCPGGNRPSAMPPVLPSQDQVSRLTAILTWLNEAMTMGTPTPPHEKQMLLMLAQQRLDLLKKQNPKAHADIAQKFAQLEQMHQSPGGQPPAQAALSSSGGGPAAPPQSQEKPNGGESISISYRDMPEDIKRQAEAKAGFTPSTLPPKPEPTAAPKTP